MEEEEDEDCCERSATSGAVLHRADRYVTYGADSSFSDLDVRPDFVRSCSNPNWPRGSLQFQS